MRRNTFSTFPYIRSHPKSSPEPGGKILNARMRGEGASITALSLSTGPCSPSLGGNPYRTDGKTSRSKTWPVLPATDSFCVLPYDRAQADAQ